MRVPGAARAMLAALVSLCAAANTAAQTDRTLLPSRSIAPPELVLPPIVPSDSIEARLLAVQRWTREYEAWKAWFIRWHNRLERGWFSSRERRQPPVPPPWLADACAALVEDTGPIADGCTAWREWRRGDLFVLRTERVLQTRAALEAPRKSAWWQHLHLDALWPMTEVGSNAFGVVGTHVTLPLTDRVQVFLAPGAILMRLPSRDGEQAWTAAADWGFSYRLVDFSMPGVRRPTTLHVNFARVWILGATSLPGQKELYLAGFSLSFKPRTPLPSGR